jgi:hypothetical protein
LTLNDTASTAKTLPIPVTARIAYFRSLWSAVNAIADLFRTGSISGTLITRHVATATLGANNTVAFTEQEILTPQTIYYNVSSASDSVLVRALGWQEDPMAYK